MAAPSDYLDAACMAVDRSSDPLIVPWPMPGNLTSFQSFDTFAAWRRFVLQFSLHDSLPQVVAVKFQRAQKLHLLAWIGFDLITAGQLMAMTTLELALKDRYWIKAIECRMQSVLAQAKTENRTITNKEKSWANHPHFADLLKYMVKHDGLTDNILPLNQRCGPRATVVGRLTGETRPSLADIRNTLAHGDTSGDFPVTGLLELVRDLINYAFRQYIAEFSR